MNDPDHTAIQTNGFTTPVGPVDVFDESIMWQFAEKYGSFELTFGPREATSPGWNCGPLVRQPDAMPWTLSFCKETGDTSNWTHHFAGFNLPDLFKWAGDFIEGRVDEHGQVLTQS